MKAEKATRHSCNYTASCLPIAKSSKASITDYERGALIAAWMFAVMFAFLSVGVVMFGW